MLHLYAKKREKNCITIMHLTSYSLKHQVLMLLQYLKLDPIVNRRVLYIGESSMPFKIYVFPISFLTCSTMVSVK